MELGYSVKSLIYGPETKLTALIASHQLIHGNEMFSLIGSNLRRYLIGPNLLNTGDLCGILDLQMDRFKWEGFKQKHKIQERWIDFLLLAHDNFQLLWEFAEVGLSREEHEITRSEGAKGYLEIPPPKIHCQIPGIPNTERAVKAL